MTGVASPPFPDTPPRSERSPGVKLAIAVLIAVALMVPLLMVYGLVWDRQQQAETAQAAIGEGWGGSQTIAGPVIVIPYRATEAETVSENGRDVTRNVTRVRELFLSPLSNRADVTIKPEKRKKAIYETVVYESRIAGTARFALPADLARYGVTREALLLDRAEVRLGISDARGLIDGNSLTVNGTPAALQPGKGLLSSGSSGTFAFINWVDGAPLELAYRVGVRGLGDFRMVPRGVDTRFNVRSVWPNPSFGGDFLPTTRAVRDNGFTATYAISNLALGQAQVLTEDLGRPVDGETGEVYVNSIQFHNKRRHIMERHTFDSSLIDVPVSRNQPGGRIQFERRDRLHPRKHSGFQRHGRKADDAVSAHRAEPFVVDEQNSSIGFGRDRRRDDTTVHIRVAARFPHQRRSPMIKILFGKSPPSQDCVALQFGKAADDDAKRFAFGVRVNRRDSMPIGRRVPT